MKIYTEKNGSKYSPVGGYKKLYWTNKGWYFLFRGRRVYGSDVPSLSYPVMVEDEAGKLIVIGGYMELSNCFGLLVEIDPDCESARLWSEVV